MFNRFLFENPKISSRVCWGIDDDDFSFQQFPKKNVVSQSWLDADVAQKFCDSSEFYVHDSGVQAT